MGVFTNLNLSKPHRLWIIMEIWGFPGGSVAKNLPTVQETQAQSLVWDDPLEEGMATHSSVLAWRTPWTEEPGGLQFRGRKSQTRLKRLHTQAWRRRHVGVTHHGLISSPSPFPEEWGGRGGRS